MVVVVVVIFNWNKAAFDECVRSHDDDGVVVLREMEVVLLLDCYEVWIENKSGASRKINH